MRNANLLDALDLSLLSTAISHLLLFLDLLAVCRAYLPNFAFSSSSCESISRSKKINKFFIEIKCKLIQLFELTLHMFINHINHVVIRFSGDGAVVVRCMFLISFDKPNFHSISDCACALFFVHLKIEKSFRFYFNEFNDFENIFSVLAYSC